MTWQSNLIFREIIQQFWPRKIIKFFVVVPVDSIVIAILFFWSDAKEEQKKITQTGLSWKQLKSEHWFVVDAVFYFDFLEQSGTYRYVYFFNY